MTNAPLTATCQLRLRPVGRIPGAQTAVYARNALGLVTHAETRNGSSQLVVAYGYVYDAARRRRSVTDSRPSMGIAKQLAYTWTPGWAARQLDQKLA